MTAPTLEQRRLAAAGHAQAVHRALQAEIDKLGFAPPAPAVTDLAQAETRLERDPASGQDSLVYEWRDARGHRVGGLVLHADDSFFAEFDVVRPHPRRPHLFVEAVSAWGRGADIRAEPRLLAMPT